MATPPAPEPAKPEPPAKPAAPPPDAKPDFRYIVRIANTDLDGKRTVVYGLTKVKGCGIRVAEVVADLIGVPRTERVGNLTDAQVQQLEEALAKFAEKVPPWMVNRPGDWETGEDLHAFAGEVDGNLRNDINRMQMIRSYKGVRHETGQKVRGQRTRSNGRTGLTVGVLKKVAKEQAKKAAAEEEAEKDKGKKPAAEEKKPEEKKAEEKKPEPKKEAK